MEPSEGWWNNYGFASFGEYLKASHEEGDKVAALFSRRKRSQAPAAQLPGGATPEARPLVKAARIYGVAASTMARLLVQRGAQLAVEEKS
jgi:hypothetical protein